MSADKGIPSAAQVEAAEGGRPTHPWEPHAGGIAGRLNWLRAAVLGANDGIVSVAGIVIGVAGATTALGPIFTAGLAGLVAGAVSMALGEYVSVSSQSDSEHAQIAQEKRELASAPEAELTELTALYEAKGLSAATARIVAVELTARDPVAAHLDAELHIGPANIPNPVQAAGDVSGIDVQFGVQVGGHGVTSGQLYGDDTGGGRGPLSAGQRPWRQFGLRLSRNA